MQDAVDRVTKLIARTMAQYTLKMYGSRYTGLAGPRSDINLNLSIPDFDRDPSDRGPSATRPEGRRASGKALMMLVDSLRQDRRYAELYYKPTARYPVVSAIDNPTGLRIKFTTLNPGFHSRNLPALYLSEFPSLRPLDLLLQHCLRFRSLLAIPYGGIGSYPLFIMIMTALKLAPHGFARHDHGRQLLHVLEFYAKADLSRHGFSADPPVIFDKRSLNTKKSKFGDDDVDLGLGRLDLFLRYNRDYLKPGRLTLQDPVHPLNDLGGHSHLITQIQAVFNNASEGIRRAVQLWDERVSGQDEFSVLSSLAGANYRAVERDRARVRSGPATAKAMESSDGGGPSLSRPVAGADGDGQPLSRPVDEADEGRDRLDRADGLMGIGSRFLERLRGGMASITRRWGR